MIAGLLIAAGVSLLALGIAAYGVSKAEKMGGGIGNDFSEE